MEASVRNCSTSHLRAGETYGLPRCCGDEDLPLRGFVALDVCGIESGFRKGEARLAESGSRFVANNLAGISHLFEDAVDGVGLWIRIGVEGGEAHVRAELVDADLAGRELKIRGNAATEVGRVDARLRGGRSRCRCSEV